MEGDPHQALLELCKLGTPIVKRVPKQVLPLFAKGWAELLWAAVTQKTLGAWWSFLAYPRVVLLARKRGGKKLKEKHSLASMIQVRIQSWPYRTRELYNEVRDRDGRKPGDKKDAKPVVDKQPGVESRVVSAIRLGDIRKALRLLVAAPLADTGPATGKALEELHPKGTRPPLVPSHPTPRFSGELVGAALSSFGPGSAGGLFGYTPFLLQQCFRSEASPFAAALTAAVNHLSDGEAPSFLQPFLAGGVSIALRKGATGIRPLCCGDPLRRLVAKCFCFGGKKDIDKVFKRKNYGVGCPGGIEVVAHSLRDVLGRCADSRMALLKIDFRNAFNRVDRATFMHASCGMFPALAKWTNWCYGQPSVLLFDRRHVIHSTAGVQQGDPLGPLYFCFALLPLVEEISRLGPVYQKWYLDDGGIVAPASVLVKVWEILRTKGPPMGLDLNPQKCEWSWVNPTVDEECPIEGVTKVPTSEISMLGVPLGSASFAADFVDGKLMPRLAEAMDRLEALEDSQSALYLLRVSFSIVRATHFMRSTPLAHWRAQAEAFDARLRRTAEAILGSPFSDPVYAQAALSPSLGGLGLRRSVDHADAAFAASWRESSRTAEEEWLPPPQVEMHFGSQKEASLRIDAAIHTRLVSEASSARERQRLHRVTEPHSGAFITAVPSMVDGSD